MLLKRSTQEKTAEAAASALRELVSAAARERELLGELVERLAHRGANVKATADAITRLDASMTEAGARLAALQEQSATAANQLGTMRSAATAAAREQQQVRDAARQAKDDAAAAAAKVHDIEQKLAGFARLQEAARTLDEKLAALNGTVEHVTQRAKVLDQQKEVVERAIVEAHRLSGMITSMESQAVRLEEGRQQAATVEETLARVEQLVRQSAQQLDEAGQRRDSLNAELDRLQRERTAVVEFIGKYEDHLSGARRQLEASETRAAAIEAGLRKTEKVQEGVAAREQDLARMAERIAALERDLASAVEHGDEAARKATAVETLQQDLVRVEEMARRATW